MTESFRVSEKDKEMLRGIIEPPQLCKIHHLVQYRLFRIHPPLLRQISHLIFFVIFSSHQMSYVEEFCEDIAIINQGEVVLSGSLDTIKEEYGSTQIRMVEII